MKRFKFVIAAGSLTLLLILVGIVLFLWRVGTVSLPQEDGAIRISGVSSETEIFRDSLGVPYIVAASDSDAYFALGFVHAQDRLFQMEMYRRLGEGRLSEVFGPKTLPVDELFRTLRFSQMADSLYDQSSELTKDILRWYSNGVNTYLESAKALPVEFEMLKITPKPWRPVDCLLVARLMSWELNLAWWTKPVFGELYNKLGAQRASLLIPLSSIHARGDVSGIGAGTAWEAEKRFLDLNSTALSFITGSSSPSGIGSNNWTISPRRTNTGSAILCNDPHLAFSLPAKWYFVSITSPSLHVIGVTLPGTPGVVIGRNADIAWGMTNVMADDSDFYIMHNDSADASMYWYDNKLLAYRTEYDTIRVKGRPDYVFQTKMSVLGPVVSDVIADSYEMSQLRNEPTGPNETLSLRWAAYWPSDETRSIYLLNTARNYEEFLEALKYFGSPAQNFVYADVKGNIGYKAAGNIPLRKYPEPYLPQPGNSNKYVWTSFIPFAMMPESYNPSAGFIATANNPTAPPNYPYYITNLYEPSSRIDRIKSFLSEHDTMSVNLCRDLQLDYRSVFFDSLDREIIDACDTAGFAPEQLVYLKNFDGSITENSTAAAILNVAFVELMKEVFEPVMGQTLFKKYVLISNVPTRIVESFLRDPKLLGELYNVDNGDSLMDVMLARSLRVSLKTLESRYGTNSIGWQWGRIHKLELKYLLSSNPLIARLYNLGPFPRGGNNTTVNNGEYSFDDPYGMLIGPSMRMIVDMKRSGIYFSLPGGECGQLLSPHYSDFLKDYLDGIALYFPQSANLQPMPHNLKLLPLN